MKGVIFIALNDMVEQHHGIAVWETILARVNPESGGVYTATDDYPDEEIVAFVKVICETLKLPSSAVTQRFGHYLFGELNRKYPMFSESSPNLFAFLESIEGVIHKEVKKLYDSPNLPTINCQLEAPHQLVMRYASPRKQCYLAEGLILGAAAHYRENVTLTHARCMHQGADACEILVTKDG